MDVAHITLHARKIPFSLFAKRVGESAGEVDDTAQNTGKIEKSRLGAIHSQPLFPTERPQNLLIIVMRKN